MGLTEPTKITSNEYRFDSFDNGKTLLNKKKGKLPAMGWNSWNAFGSGNTEALTKIMADKIVELGLDKLGYKYLVLDDGCYKAERVNGKICNEPVKFPSGFKALSDYIHSKNLKFGMYNDIGIKLCAGAPVGTCGYEKQDAKSYLEWGVDFLKIDNCYYLWDNATFSDPTNAKYVYCPNIKGITIKTMGTALSETAIPAAEGKITGEGPVLTNNFVTNIGTFDGTNTGTTPIGPRSGELSFTYNAKTAGKHSVTVEYATGEEPGTGSWLQLAVSSGSSSQLYFDNLLPSTPDKTTFQISEPIEVELKEGENLIRIMNHRRQENTLMSYAAMLEGLNEADPNHDVLLSLCEWGKTQPQNWGYKVADSWRILNDITFRVGSDGDPGYGSWSDPGTPSVTSQYDKAVIMDEFAGLDKGWNDPDMMMIGMTGLTPTMNKTHFTMWCMLNSPLMLGLDLRRVQKDDELYNIIANKDLIDLNQDRLGIQAKRVWTSFACAAPDKEYIQEHQRVDVLAKPLADGSVAVSVINLNETDGAAAFTLEMDVVIKGLGAKCPEGFAEAASYDALNLWNGERAVVGGALKIEALPPCDSITLKLTPAK